VKAEACEQHYAVNYANLQTPLVTRPG